MPVNQPIVLSDAGRELTEPTPIDGVQARFSGLVAGNFGTHRGLVRLLLGEAEYLAGRLNVFLRPDLQQTRRLVYVCLGNINRSPFAENIATSMGLHAISIGLATSTGAPAFDTAVTTARRFDIDLTAHRAIDFVDYERAEGDLLLAMEIRHAHRLLELGVPEKAIALLGHWATPHRVHIHDPHTLSDAYFLTCFTVIQSAVRELALACREAESPCVAR